jgi:hypothetical protein
MGDLQQVENGRNAAGPPPPPFGASTGDIALARTVMCG